MNLLGRASGRRIGGTGRNLGLEVLDLMGPELPNPVAASRLSPGGLAAAALDARSRKPATLQGTERIKQPPRCHRVE
jgi:hypothetical protein